MPSLSLAPSHLSLRSPFSTPTWRAATLPCGAHSPTRTHSLPRCDEGYFGADCSRPTTAAAAAAALASAPAAAASPPVLRPLIYVYDLPPHLHTHIFQYRMSASNCRHRRFNSAGGTDWIGGL